MKDYKLLDCTLRDGGYYNNWDFSKELTHAYLKAMEAIHVDYVEIGFRSLKNTIFKGPYAYSTDAFLSTLEIPQGLQGKLGVMINGAEVSQDHETVLSQLFQPQSTSPVSLVRIACHYHEFEACLPASQWLKEQGYAVGFNIMQISDRSDEEIAQAAKSASQYPIDVLYFADSLGSLVPEDVTRIVKAFQGAWEGDLGMHAHDNMNLAIPNSTQGMCEGVRWIDCTVTGMGRGPGNTATEYLVLENADLPLVSLNKLLNLISVYFQPLKNQYQWGSNPYYFLAGQYGIHPSYIQEMLTDDRYSVDETLSAIEHLKVEGGKKFNLNTLEASRNFFIGEAGGAWDPKALNLEQDVLILGAGPNLNKYKKELESYISEHQPLVLALNAHQSLDEASINLRLACHQVRLLADLSEHSALPQPLVAPISMMPSDISHDYASLDTFDYGVCVKKETFDVHANYCVLPNLLAISYALAIVTRANAKRILLAGFDGYGCDDTRGKEVNDFFTLYQKQYSDVDLFSITPTYYDVKTKSIYAFER